MTEIRGWSLSDLIHCHGSMSSLFIADRHSDGRLRAPLPQLIYMSKPWNQMLTEKHMDELYILTPKPV